LKVVRSFLRHVVILNRGAKHSEGTVGRVMPGTVTRDAVSGLRALKFAIEDALPRS
jgi:hypothetical protein